MSLKNILPPKRKKNYHFLFLLGFIFLTQAISAQAVTDIKNTKTCNEYGGTCENSLICSSGKIDKGDCDGWSITNPNNCCVYGTAITPMSEEECNSAPVLGICQLSPCTGDEILVGGCGLASNCCRKKNSAIIAPSSSTSSFDYTPLEPIPGATNDTSTLAGFLEGLYFFVMWSAGVMAMFMIGLGGFWYLTSAGNTSRVGEAKTIIVNALLGLLVLTFTWLILYIINPDLTKLDWSSLEDIAVDVGSETGTGNKSIIDTPTTVGCGKIVEAAHAMVNSGCKYSQARRNACTGNPGYTDCSDFTYHAYKKAGCSTGFGNTTATMVGKTPTFNGDQSSLKAGDALVYNNGGSGHVVICEQDGCNTITHASGEKAGLKKGASSGYIFKKSNLHVIRAETFCANAKDASC